MHEKKSYLFHDGLPVTEHHGDGSGRDGEDAELDVPHPDGDVGALQDLLEEDAGEAGADGGHHRRKEADYATLVLRRRLD